MRFIADDMLGRLAKWLRITGYDVFYSPPAADAELLRRASSEGRILLTRDSHLVKRGVADGNYVFIKSEDLWKQLKQVINELGLEIGKDLMSRCSVCNGKIIPVEKYMVKGKVPPYVFKTHKEFAKCPKCGRIYWKGTHYRRILAIFSKLQNDSKREI